MKNPVRFKVRFKPKGKKKYETQEIPGVSAIAIRDLISKLYDIKWIRACAWSKCCRKCEKDKELTEFYDSHTNKTDGKQPYCISCQKEYVMQQEADKMKDPDYSKKKKAYNRKRHRERYQRMPYPQKRKYLISLAKKRKKKIKESKAKPL